MKLFLKLSVLTTLLLNAAVMAEDWPWEGSGTSSDPFLINTVEDFNKIDNDPFHMDKHYALTAQLDFEGAEPNAIGSQEYPFQGQFVGKYVNPDTGKTAAGSLKNFSLTSNGPRPCGIFRVVGSEGKIYSLTVHSPVIASSSNAATGGIAGRNNGVINECTVSNAQITGKNGVGGIAGYNSGIINFCGADGQIIGENTTGGICGYLEGGELTQSTFYGQVTGQEYTGGAVGGINAYSSVSDCFASAEITGGSYAGGFCGTASESTIIDCVVYGSVEASGWAGGMCGINYAEFKTCAAYSDVSAVSSLSYGLNNLTLKADTYVGGFAGINNNVIENCFARGNVQSVVNAGGFSISDFIESVEDQPSVLSYSFAGGFAGLNSGSISRCYSVGQVDGGLLADSNSSPYVNDPNFVTDVLYEGGFTGKNDSSVSGSYFDKDTSGLTGEESDGGQAKTTAEMENQNTYANWDFAQTWRIDGGYPQFMWQVSVSFNPSSITKSLSQGEVPVFKPKAVMQGEGSLSCQLSVEYSDGNGWLSAAPASFELNKNEIDQTLDVSLNPAGLPAGIYEADIVLSSAALEYDALLPVKMAVLPANGDFNNDSKVDIADFVKFAAIWKDQSITISELKDFASNWLN
ncbi:GLUG domain protein [Sedimentisphaera salicampi]|nr:GLUG domain protein [Sedimentisphaera salicampi]